MTRRTKRITRKKAIPLYFQRSLSSSQFLATAQYKHQIKKLKKVNKELACSLQEAKCRAADSERALTECNRDNTQMMYVKMKIKAIVETVQKLVTDMGEVYDVIDGKTFDILKNCTVSHQEARIHMRNPSFSTIEESASMSTIEPDLSKEERLSFESATKSAIIKSPASPFFDADSSQTEIYNIPLVLAAEQKLSNTSNGKQSAVTTRSSKSLERTNAVGRSSKSLERANVVTRSSKSLERTNVVTRSSNSLEKNGIPPSDQASPSTPQTPVFRPNFPTSINLNCLEDTTKLKPTTSQAPNETQKVADPPKLTPKITTSKIPVKKLASSEKFSGHIAVPSNYIDQSKAYNVSKNIAEPQMPLPASDRRGTFVLDTLACNAKSDIISDRRGTFVLDASAFKAKSDVISDRRGTFVLNSLADNDKPDPIIDRRTTYFIPAQSEKQPDPSPPKAVEAPNPVQNVTTNQTILLCEDMELTEIIPFQNQAHQFKTAVPPWFEKPETKESVSSEKLSDSDRNQFLCQSTPSVLLSVSNVNSSKQSEVITTQAVPQSAQIKNIFSGIKDIDKSSASKVLSEKNLLAKATVSHQDRNPVNLQQMKNKGKDVNKMLNKEERNANIKNSAKELPSPISHFAKTDLSVQHKIFQSISATSAISEKNKQTSDALLVADENEGKKSTISKDSISDKQPVVDNAEMPVQENAASPKTRNSRKKQSAKYIDFFTDSDESVIDFDVDFIPEKRLSVKPGRKIINPNNKKVFVFKKNTTKQSTDKDIPTDSCSDKTPIEASKSDTEQDVFNFSASSEASKSPVKKEKKRKSVMPKSNKQNVNRKSIVDPMLSKRKSKKNVKPEVNQAEVPALPRKSILCLNKDNGSIPFTPVAQSYRKSVRFTLSEVVSQDEQIDPNCGLSNELSAAPCIQKTNDVLVTEKEPSPVQRKRTSGRKKSGSAQPTEDEQKCTNVKLVKSRKRLSSNLNLNSTENVREAECVPNKKFHITNEIPPKIEIHASGVHELNMGVKEHSHGVSGTVSSAVLEKTTDSKKEKKSAGIHSELRLNPNSNAKVSGSSGKIEGKRPFSGVSERRSSKKEPMVDDLFLDLDNAVSQIIEKKAETPSKPVEDEPIEEMAKLMEAGCNKASSVKPKVSKQKKNRAKKESSKKRKTGSELFEDKENTSNNVENVKIDILSSNHNLDTLLGSKESVSNAKPKKSRKKDSAPLLQKDLKTDILSSENTPGSADIISGRSRRSKPVISFKEPSLNSKMRRG